MKYKDLKDLKPGDKVEKLKKYYVHLIPNNSDAYLNYDPYFKDYLIGSKNKHILQTKFNKKEIKKFDLPFEIKPEALKEVPEDEVS